MGGMTKAIVSGMPKLRIEESAARRQAKIDSGAEVIVGVNKYRLAKEETNFEVLRIDNSKVRDKQIDRINRVKQARDGKQVQAILERIRQAARDGKENLLGLAVEAAKARATVGEISSALEDVFGRHVPKENIVRGAYSKEATTKTGDKGKNEFEAALDTVKNFAKNEGRNPRILVAKMGQDGHDRGAKVIASGFADLGFDVDVGGLFQTPEEVARQAIDNDVHVVGVSSLAAGHKTLVPALKQALIKQGGDHIVLICGGVIPQGDYDFLLENGASMVFGPGTKVTDAATSVVHLLEKRKK